MKNTIRVAALLLVAGLTAALIAQPVSDVPLRNVRLPIFNEAGYKIWDLEAAEVRTLALDTVRLELTNAHVRMLAGDDAGTLEGELFAPQAVVDQQARTITGKGQLHAISGGAELFGDDWSYDANTKSIVIERNIVVTFAGDLGRILR